MHRIRRIAGVFFNAGLTLGLSLGLLATGRMAQGAVQLQPVVSGLSQPVLVTNARDGSNRLFIVEQTGAIKVLPTRVAGSPAPTVFLNIASKIASPNGSEQGLLGLAFHPQYATNRRFFVNYTRLSDGATVISEYQASSTNANVADTTEKVLLVIAQPFANHNGGMIAFGLDGFLYIGMGDGGSANDPGNRSQNIEELLGKMLRINVDVANGSVPYSSPPDNPFFGATPGRDEIYAVGFRNPFRFSFDRTTGALYAGDVGQGQREEVDIVTRGGNYGWRVIEGTRCTGLDASACSNSGFTAPITEYDHSVGCSITGGYVYRGTLGTLPAGTYLYGDYCGGQIFQYSGGTSSLLLATSLNISSFGEDEAGELYVAGLGGTVDRLVSTTEVRLISFDAKVLSDGVWLSWRTGWESDNLGFHVFRQVKSGGQWQRAVRLTPQLVAGGALQAGQTNDAQGGFVYGWADKQATPAAIARYSLQGVRYWLQDVDTHGQIANHGPVPPTPGTGTLSGKRNSKMLSELGR